MNIKIDKIQTFLLSILMSVSWLKSPLIIENSPTTEIRLRKTIYNWKLLVKVIVQTVLIQEEKSFVQGIRKSWMRIPFCWLFTILLKSFSFGVNFKNFPRDVIPIFIHGWKPLQGEKALAPWVFFLYSPIHSSPWWKWLRFPVFDRSH